MPAFIDIEPGWIQDLSPAKDGTAGFHRWSTEEKDALALAQAARRPLLVRGEPGTGKTQLAKAAARYLGWQMQTVVIHPRYEATDLLYQFDAVRRLSDAQAKRRLKGDAAYWRPGPLWRALDPAGALQMIRHAAGRVAASDGADTENPNPSHGQVVLIDEIDKADSDLPNSLLEVLGQRGFTVPGLGNRWVRQTGDQPPLVLVTTNEERDLPAAFLRRCIVLNLQAREGAYKAWLIERGEAHHGAHVPKHRRIAPDILAMAADQLVEDRARVEAAGLSPPGPAELLDLLEALLALTAAEGRNAPKRQRELLGKLSGYAFLKHGEVDGHPLMSQSRSPLSEPGGAD